MNEQNETSIPFLEQVKLFAETMDERFIHSSSGKCDNGKSLLIFALDAQDKSGKVKHAEMICGDRFDLAYSIMTAMQKDEIINLFEDSTVVFELGVKNGYIKPK